MRTNEAHCKDRSMDRNAMAHSEQMTVETGLFIKVREG